MLNACDSVSKRRNQLFTHPITRKCSKCYALDMRDNEVYYYSATGSTWWRGRDRTSSPQRDNEAYYYSATGSTWWRGRDRTSRLYRDNVVHYHSALNALTHACLPYSIHSSLTALHTLQHALPCITPLISCHLSCSSHASVIDQFISFSTFYLFFTMRQRKSIRQSVRTPTPS